MLEFRYTVTDPQGIHARPAGLFVKEASEVPCAVTVVAGAKEVDAKRILGVMSLGVKCGQEILIRVEGEGEENAFHKLMMFLEHNL